MSVRFFLGDKDVNIIWCTRFIIWACHNDDRPAGSHIHTRDSEISQDDLSLSFNITTLKYQQLKQ